MYHYYSSFVRQFKTYISVEFKDPIGCVIRGWDPFSRLLIVILLTQTVGCVAQGIPTFQTQSQSPTVTLTVSPSEQPEVTVSPEGETPLVQSQIEALVEIAPTRTPEPTATPDAIGDAVVEIVQETGLSGQRLVGLGVEDWINLVISLLFVLFGYLVGTLLIHRVFPNLVSRTKTYLDDQLLQVSGNELRWIFVLIILRLSTRRLDFLQAEFKRFLLDVYFFLILFLAIAILWRLIDLAAKQAEVSASKAGRQKQVESLIVLVVWGMRFVVIIFSISVSLIHFGINITGFAIFIGVIGFALSLGARDVLADIIAGAFILVDRPYRVGDRIELPEIDSWGDVVNIGMRSTKILTLDNRMVIVPNSQIGKNQVINYSYPDPSFYDMSKIVVAYDNDVEQVAQLIVEAIRSVEIVQKERDIDALLMEFAENHMVFSIGWWIENYKDRFFAHDQVNKAVIMTLKEAGIVLPYRKSLVNMDKDDRSK